MTGACSLDVSVSQLSKIAPAELEASPFTKTKFQYPGQSYLATTGNFLFPQADGTLLTVMNSFGKIILQKFKADGSPETSFNNGKFDKDLGGVGINLMQVIREGPNSLLYVGYYRDDNGDPFLTTGRIFTSGVLDSNHSLPSIPLSSVFDMLYIAKDNQGDRYFVINGTENNGEDMTQVYAFHNDGTLDTSFGNQGVSEINYMDDPTVTSGDTFGALVQQDGKILIYGEVNHSGPMTMLLMRLENNGALDVSFNGTGIVTTQIDGIQLRGVFAAIQQSSGKIILAGTDNANTGSVIYRMNLNATRDTSFGVSSVFAASKSIVGDLKSITLTNDDRILVSGCYFAPGGDCTLRVTRLTVEGLADSSFGTGGTVSDNDYFSQNSYTVGLQVVVDSAGRVCTTSSSNQHFPMISFVSCFLTNGNKDASFGESGNVVAAARGAAVAPIVIQKTLNSEDLLLSGDVYVGTTAGMKIGWFLEKKLPNGLKVTNFATAGSYTSIPAVGVEEKINSLYQNSLGDIFVLGNKKLAGLNPKAPFVAKFNSQGVPDNSFGVSGRVDWASTLDHYDVMYFAFDSVGRIYVVGTIYSGVHAEKVFAYRINSDGSFDSSFGASGVLLVNLGSDVTVRGVDITSDNKILVAGSKVDQFYVTRLLQDGSQDTTFGNNGEWLSAQTMIMQTQVVITSSSIWFSGAQGGTMSTQIAKLDKNGQLDSGWNSGTWSTSGIGMGMAVDEQGRVAQIVGDVMAETQKVVLLDETGVQVAEKSLGAFTMASVMYTSTLLVEDNRLFLLGLEDGGNGEALLDRVVFEP